jgi:hypothetical protein
VEPAATGKKDHWPKSVKIFRAALNEALSKHGKDCDPFGDGTKVKAVATSDVRAEFSARYPSDAGDAAKQKEAKLKAFKRAMRQALEHDLIGAREIEGNDHLWLATHQA